MADDDAEGQRTGVKEVAANARCVCALLAGVDLDLVLEARPRSVRIDNEGSQQECAVQQSLGSENDGQTCRSS